MESIDYYKSLVSDDEVIKALLKESKAREGELEKTRVRPNLNFFQRTVSNLVSINKRISIRQEELRAKEKLKNKNDRPRKQPVRRKTQLELVREILTKRIEFVKSSDSSDRLDNKNENCGSSSDDKMDINPDCIQERLKLTPSLENETHICDIPNALKNNFGNNIVQIQTELESPKFSNLDIDVISLSDTDSCHDVDETINILDSSSESEKNYRKLKKRKKIKRRKLKNR